MNKSIILTSIAAALAWALFKINNLINAGKKIEILNPRIYALKIDLENSLIRFQLDIDIKNPSKESFTIKPKHIDLFSVDQQFLARASARKVTFKLPPKSTRTIQRTDITIPTISIPDLIYHGLRQQLIADVFIKVNGIDLRLTQLIEYNLQNQ